MAGTPGASIAIIAHPTVCRSCLPQWKRRLRLHRQLRRIYDPQTNELDLVLSLLHRNFLLDLFAQGGDNRGTMNFESHYEESGGCTLISD